MDREEQYSSEQTLNPAVKCLTLVDLGRLIEHLGVLGYELFGPTERDQAIFYDRISSLDDLPAGRCDEQEGGYYRLRDSGDESLFSYVVGPDTWKKYLFTDRETLFTAEQVEDGSLVFKAPVHPQGKRALIGIRPCEIQAIEVQDRVFLGGDYVDDAYAARRRDLLMVAVNCTRAAATCFCASVDTGPRATAGFDLVLTEVLETESHYFTLQVGSDEGAAAIDALHFDDAASAQVDIARIANDGAREQQRALDTAGLKERLYQNIGNDDYWADVASRCLSCGNCTMVCPTCFCSSVEDVTDLDGGSVARVRHWDSCFNLSHSHIAGGSVRRSGLSRYRQWMTHKLASWQDQFDTLGCVGCGRCVTWCPVGIDLTTEVGRLPPAGQGEDA